jgi:large subunit ribosomal protein L25
VAIQEHLDMAQRATLQAERRTVLGKKVKQLRNQGLLPGNIYGRALESVAIQLDAKEFVHTVREAGIRSMFELSLQGESKPRFVIVRGLDRAGGTGSPLHVDLYQVDLRRPVQTNVPLVIEGDSAAVRDLAGTFLQSIDIVAVECLPMDIPSNIVVDISVLDSFDKTITVGDLVAPEGVSILTDPSVSVATVAPPRIRAEEEEGEELEGEAAEGEEGEAPEGAAGEEPAGE